MVGIAAYAEPPVASRIASTASPIKSGSVARPDFRPERVIDGMNAAKAAAALIWDAEARGMERAAKLLDKRIESLVADHGSHEWDTNVTNLPEWVETATEELEAQAAAIRAAKATP